MIFDITNSLSSWLASVLFVGAVAFIIIKLGGNK